MMTQPTVPPKDDKERQETDDPPPVAEERKLEASKEATDAEAKADEAAEAKRTSE